MNEPKQMTRPEKINLVATVVGPLLITAVIAWASWSFNARITMEMQAQEKRIAETYVNKQWFQAYHEETTKKLEGISSDVSHVQQDVATIKGELSVQSKK